MKIALSGSCHSGKTVLLEKLKNCKNVVTYDENIRENPLILEYGGIENIRRIPSEYLNLELDAINSKMYAELNAKNKYINIFDRSIFCSMYYYMFYTDKASLSNSNLTRYFNFLEFLMDYSKEFIYDKIIILNPIPPKQNLNDKFRTKNLTEIQYIEFNTICALTHQLVSNDTEILYMDALKITDYDIEEILKWK